MQAKIVTTRRVRTALVVCSLMLTAGFFVKAPCLSSWESEFLERFCYNDIQFLYDQRGIDQGVFPYVHGRLEGDSLVDGAIEYPVLTGLFMWASGTLVDDADSYLIVSAILLAPSALIVAVVLTRMTGWRSLLWAAAPALGLYAFHNWDLLVVAAAAAGFWFWRIGKPDWAGALFGVGGAFKLYPLLFLAPLAFERWVAGKRGEAVSSAATGVGTFALLNLPFVLANPSGWLATYEFQRIRPAFLSDYSIWIWGLPSLSSEQVNMRAAAWIGALSVGALLYGWWRAKKEGAYPFIQVSAALVASFLIFSKVHSPQYALWVIPFLALLRVHLLWWIAYSIVDLALFFGGAQWFYGITQENFDVTFAKDVMLVGVWGRPVVLALLFLAFLGSHPVSSPMARGPDWAEASARRSLLTKETIGA